MVVVILSVHGEELGCFRDKDLGFSIVEVHSYLAIDDLHTISCEEDVAQLLTLTEAGVRNINMYLTLDLIGQSYEELTASECIESIINPLLLERMVNNVLCLTSAVDCLHELVNVVVLIEIAPHNFTIVGIVTTSKALLAAIVEEGNTSCSK